MGDSRKVPVQKHTYHIWILAVGNIADVDCLIGIGFNMKEYRKLITPISILVIISGMYVTLQTKGRRPIYQPPYKIVQMEIYSFDGKLTKEENPSSDNKTVSNLDSDLLDGNDDVLNS